MKSTNILRALLMFAASITFAAEPQPPACTLIKPEKLVVHEDGSRDLAATTLLNHGRWAVSGGVIKGTHGDEAHPASLKFDQPFENCVLTFRIKFTDPGSFHFGGGQGGMSVDFTSAESTLKIIERRERDSDGKLKGAKVARTAQVSSPTGEWTNVLIEHAGDQVRVKIGDAETTAKGTFEVAPGGKKFFSLNAGAKPGTRVEFDDIAFWTGPRLK